MTRGEKRKFPDSKPTMSAKSVKKEDLAKEKADYNARKAVERKMKKEGSAAPKREVKHMVWAGAHQGINPKVVDKQKKHNECTQCRMNKDTWKFCRKPVKVWALYRGRAKTKRQASFAPKQSAQVATVGVDSLSESSKGAAERPPARAFEDDNIL